jgi:quinol monooxygenase YgiN
MSKVSYVIQMTINDGMLDKFKEMAKGFASQTEASEPGTLGYQWWLAEDGKHCLLVETFESSEAMVTHLGNVGPALAPITRLEVCGTVSAEAREILAGLNAVHFPHLAGFER